jgi:PKD repeat protein
MGLGTHQRARTPRPPLRRRPDLERLEERWVPSAVRYLPGFDANALVPGDDNSSRAVPIGFNIDFHGRTFDRLFVNNNGNVTFGRSAGSFNPDPLNSLNRPILAPFFADADTRAAGQVRYGSYTGDPALFDFHKVFAVTWVGVGYYDRQADKTNTFQLVLIDRSDVAPGAVDVEFNYDAIAWDKGQSSTASARAGFSTGEIAPGETVELAGSGVAGAFLDGAANSLVDAPPVRFEFRPPGIYPIASQVIAEGETLTVPIVALDPAAGQSLTYTLLAGPSGASIDPATGVVTWTPGAVHPLGTYSFRVEVADSGGIPWTDAEAFTVTLENAAPDVDLFEPDFTHHPAGREFVLSGRFDDPGFNSWVATVDFGEGDGPEPLTLNADHSYTLRHTFDEEGYYTVVVTVTDSNGEAGSATYSINVLPAGSFGRVETSMTVTARPGETVSERLESASGHALGLEYTRSAEAKDAGTVFVAFYTSPPIDTTRVGVFFDLQSANLHPGDEITLTVEGETLRKPNFQFGYFDQARGEWVDLLKSPGLADVTIDAANGTMTVRFKVKDIFNGTVFTVSLPSTSPTPTTGPVRPPTAGNGDGGGGLTRDVSFTSSTQLSLVLTASRDAQRSVSGTSQGSQAASAAANGVANSGGARSSSLSLTAGIGGNEETEKGDGDGFWRWLQTDEGLLQLLLDGIDPGLLLPRKATAVELDKPDDAPKPAEAKATDEAEPEEKPEESPPEAEEASYGEFAFALVALSPYLSGNRRKKRRRKRARR